jgi:hypothetical protein
MKKDNKQRLFEMMERVNPDFIVQQGDLRNNYGLSPKEKVGERISNLMTKINQELPDGIYKYAQEKFKEELSSLYHPDIFILPITPEGEEVREYLMDYHHNEKGQLLWQDIRRYGAGESNITYDGETYNVIIVNND